MKQLFVIVLSLIMTACASSHMGKLKVGENGKVLSGNILAKCDPPSKRYVKEVELAVETAFKDLPTLPLEKLTVELNQRVQRLSDYSSKGLDFDLQYFRICQISLVKGLSAEQTTELLRNAQKAWDNAVQINNNSFSNYGINNGIQGAVVNIGELKLPKEKNFEVIIDRIIDSTGEFLVVKFNPIQGIWGSPYIGVDVGTSPTNLPSPYENQRPIIMTATGIVKIGEDSLNCQVIHQVVTKDSPIKFRVSKDISMISFGDVDSKSFYSINLY